MKTTDVNTCLTFAQKEQLSACALFSHLPDEDYKTLLRAARVIVIKEREAVISQGQAATEFFLVTDGEIKLSLISSAGQEKVMHILKPGSTFAEALMFLKKPIFPVSAIALMPSTVIAFSSKQYKSTLAKHPESCFGVLGEYSQRIRGLVDEIESLTTQNATLRVLRFLLKEIPSSQLGSTSVELHTPKHTIASRLSITPETLSRIFAKLKQENVIEITDKRVFLCDVDWMRKFVSMH